MKVGDRVKVITTRWNAPGRYDQCGLFGTVVNIYGDEGDDLAVSIEYIPDQRDGEMPPGNSYGFHDLEIIPIMVMVDPEFDLDEISRSDELIAQMG